MPTGPGVTLTTTAASALAYLERRGETAAIVFDNGQPVGVVTMQALGETAGTGASVADVMDWECVRVAPDADPLATLKAYRDGSWRSLRRRRPMATDVRRRRAARFS